MKHITTYQHGADAMHRLNTLMGWLVFALAAWVYCSTVEPTASFWDCPEFILSGYKLEVGHPPGAPFYMIVANVVSQLASDPTQVAHMVNLLNALLSAATIMLLFWTITHLVGLTPIGLLAGLTGSLTYCFSDTFWFSAVEGEVYAFSSLLTALVFWLMLKWEEHADEPHSDRYLVLIAYITGLSIGVHLLNLLCLPSIVLVWYYRRHPDATLHGSLKALLFSMVLLAAVLYGIIPGVMKLAGWSELLFTNVLHCPYNTGVLVYIVLLFSAISSGIWYTQLRGHRRLNTTLLCLLVLLMGYGSYALILIRSTANPPMDQNSPDDVFTLASYLARDQYGQRPLLYGQAYTSQPEWEPVAGTQMMQMKMKKGAPVYQHLRKDASHPEQADRYYVAETQQRIVYAQNMLFPRMWDSQKSDGYEQWMGGVKGRMVPYDYGGEQVMVKMPTQWENLKFFLSYQCNFMYWRYFMWNFCGRQNDIQGHGELEHGNWITGIAPLDNLRLGDQSLLPDTLKQNKGHNVYYGLPFLLGFIGLLWQGLRRGQRGIQQFWVVFFLFLMTGLAIVVYINQNPLQARERDYSYAGSFYAYAIWCGMGVVAIKEYVSRLLNNRLTKLVNLTKGVNKRLTTSMKWAIFAPAMLSIPLLMAFQNWDDHDRSHRTMCSDFGHNYLESCQQEGAPILFCDGDNDTFPLWYMQEVEEERTDVRVCNLNYLPTDWYIDQQRRPTAQAQALPIPWQVADYHGDRRNYVPIRPELRTQVEDYYRQHPAEARQQFGDEPFELTNILRHWVCAEEKDLQVIPTDSIYIKVDKQAVRESGMMAPDGRRASQLTDDEIPDRMTISLAGRRGLHKGQLAFLEVLANSGWRRPVYVCSSVPSSEYLNLDDYLVVEGIAERFTPFRQNRDEGCIDTERTFDNLMHRFRYGGMQREGLYLDAPSVSMCCRMRMTFAQLALELIRRSVAEDNDTLRRQARQVLERCEHELPAYNLPLTHENGAHLLARAYALLGQKAEMQRYVDAVWRNSEQYLQWLRSLTAEQQASRSYDVQRHCAVLYHLMQSVQAVDEPQAQQMARQIIAYRNAFGL